jgi:hypothetical protein
VQKNNISWKIDGFTKNVCVKFKDKKRKLNFFEDFSVSTKVKFGFKGNLLEVSLKHFRLLEIYANSCVVQPSIKAPRTSFP